MPNIQPVAITKSMEKFSSDLNATKLLHTQLQKLLVDYNKHRALLTKSVVNAETLLDDYLRRNIQDPGQVLSSATKEMQETQMSFNFVYLQLQSQMQHENRSYTAISNIMKTKHDTVKNSISNIR